MQTNTKVMLALAGLILVGMVISAAARGELYVHHVSHKTKNCIDLSHQKQDALSPNASLADRQAAYQSDTNAFELCDTGEGQ
jgi:hypothetical protein